MNCFATFDTTHMALWFEKSCRKGGLAVKVIPVPRAFSASCGLACEYPCEEAEAIAKIVEENQIEVNGYHTTP